MCVCVIIFCIKNKFKKEKKKKMTVCCVIGAGYWGSKIINTLLEMKGLDVIVCEEDKSQWQKKTGVTYYEKFPEHVSIECLFIATPIGTHFALMKKAISMGVKNIFVEKPACQNYSDYQEIRKLSLSEGVKIVVGHLMVYHPCVQKLQEIAKKGSVRSIIFNRNQRQDGKGSLLDDIAPHCLSILNCLMPERKMQVADVSGDDRRFLTATVLSGSVVSTFKWQCTSERPQNEVTMIMSDGTVYQMRGNQLWKGREKIHQCGHVALRMELQTALDWFLREEDSEKEEEEPKNSICESARIYYRTDMMKKQLKKKRSPLFCILTLTRNEEYRIQTLLDSLKPFRDRGGKHLIVDSGSTDNTCQIALSAGCLVHKVGDKFRKKVPESDVVNFIGSSYKPEDLNYFDFSGARNAGLDALSMDPSCPLMTLICDSGDEVKVMDVDKINTLLQKEDPDVVNINHYLSDTEKHISTRFFDRKKFHYSGRAHEFVEIRKGFSAKGKRPLIPITDLKIQYKRQTKKSRPYIPALALDCLENKGFHRWFYYLGRELMYHGKYTESLHVLSKAPTTGWDEELSEAAIVRGNCCVHLGRLEEGLSHYMDAVSKCGKRRQPWLKASLCAFRLKRYELSVGLAAAATYLPRQSALHEDERNYTVLPADCIYSALTWTHHSKDIAFHFWKLCVTTEPWNTRYQHDKKFFLHLIEKSKWKVPKNPNS